MKKVIFIQGILNWESRPRLLLDTLKSLGFEAIYFPLFYKLEDLDKQLELKNQIENYINTLKYNERVIILAHSFGGIVAHSLNSECYEKIGQIITVGSPHTVSLAWFQQILKRINYKNKVNVSKQYSYGMYFDKTVPFIFSQSQNSLHKNLLGTHNSILKYKSCIEKILKLSKLI